MSGLGPERRSPIRRSAEAESETGRRPRITCPITAPSIGRPRLLGLAGMIGSALRPPRAVAGMRLNVLSLAIALVLSLGLIAYSVRPSLRRPGFSLSRARIHEPQHGGGHHPPPDGQAPLIDPKLGAMVQHGATARSATQEEEAARPLIQKVGEVFADQQRLERHHRLLAQHPARRLGDEGGDRRVR